jgi:hypothetical protein
VGKTGAILDEFEMGRGIQALVVVDWAEEKGRAVDRASSGERRRGGGRQSRDTNRQQCHAAPNKCSGGSVLAALSERGRTGLFRKERSYPQICGRGLWVTFV